MPLFGARCAFVTNTCDGGGRARACAATTRSRSPRRVVHGVNRVRSQSLAPPRSAPPRIGPWCHGSVVPDGRAWRSLLLPWSARTSGRRSPGRGVGACSRRGVAFSRPLLVSSTCFPLAPPDSSATLLLPRLITRPTGGGKGSADWRCALCAAVQAAIPASGRSRRGDRRRLPVCRVEAASGRAVADCSACLPPAPCACCCALSPCSLLLRRGPNCAPLERPPFRH